MIGIALYSKTVRGTYIDTTKFGWSTISLMCKSPHTLHGMQTSTAVLPRRS